MRACYVVMLNHMARPSRRKRKQTSAVRMRDAKHDGRDRRRATESAEQTNNNSATAQPSVMYMCSFFDMPDSLSPGRLLKPCMYMSRRRRINNRRKSEK